MTALPDSPLSLWLDTYGPYTPEPPLQGQIDVDVAIIGGGFTGLATACELRRADPLAERCRARSQDGRLRRQRPQRLVRHDRRRSRLRNDRPDPRQEVPADARTPTWRRRSTVSKRRSTATISTATSSRPGFLRVATTRELRQAAQAPGRADAVTRFRRHHLDRGRRGARHGGQRALPRRHVGTSPAAGRPRQAGPRGEARSRSSWAPRSSKRRRCWRSPRAPAGAEAGAGGAGPFRLLTPSGSVTAQRLVFAANAYSHLFPEIGAASRFRPSPT